MRYISHQLQHDPDAWIDRSKNDFTNWAFLDDFPLLRMLVLEYFSQNGGVAGVLDLKIYGVADVIEKGLETVIAAPFGDLFGSLGEASQNGRNLILRDEFQFPITKLNKERRQVNEQVFWNRSHHLIFRISAFGVIGIWR
jgi:hypothetical protein